MNLRLKAIGIVSIMFASLYLIAEVGKMYLTIQMAEYALSILLVYGCYRVVLMLLEMNEYNNRPKDTFPDENA